MDHSRTAPAAACELLCELDCEADCAAEIESFLGGALFV
jgi:hypothetical protein